MSEGTPDSEQTGAVNRCPSCGAVSDGSLTTCLSCGRALAGGEGGSLDIAKWVSSGWGLFLRDIPMAVAIPLIVTVPVIALLVASYFGSIVMIILSESKGPNVVPLVSGIVIGTMILLSGLALPALQAGVSACFLHGIREGKLNAVHIWAGFRHWWACTWVGSLTTAAVILSIPLLFILIGFPLLLGACTLYWLTLFRIVDKGRGGIEALSFAFRVVGSRMWPMLVYSLLVMTLMSAGMMAMYIGVLISVPIGYAILAASYDSLSKGYDTAM